MLRPIVILLMVASFLLAGCAEHKPTGRPSAEQVAKGFKQVFYEVDPDADKDPAFNQVAHCFGEAVVDSKLSDGAVRKLAFMENSYVFTAEEVAIVSRLQNEATTNCIENAIKDPLSEDKVDEK